MLINLSPVGPEDEEFLFAVYSSTRADEMRLVDWGEAEKEAFLRMQFKAQDQFYTQNYPGAEFQIILTGEQPIGRLYTHKRENEIRIMDISLLPEYRGRGIGSSMLNRILEEASNDHLSVSIHVERNNPALHLYERLGFCLIEDIGIYLFMRWFPPILEQHEDTRKITA
jgi:ribosomal protein S18 acetylase RimI-like enzyme